MTEFYRNPLQSGAFDLERIEGKLPSWAVSFRERGFYPPIHRWFSFTDRERGLCIERELVQNPRGALDLVERQYIIQDGEKILDRVTVAISDTSHGSTTAGFFVFSQSREEAATQGAMARRHLTPPGGQDKDEFLAVEVLHLDKSVLDLC